MISKHRGHSRKFATHSGREKSPFLFFAADAMVMSFDSVLSCQPILGVLSYEVLEHKNVIYFFGKEQQNVHET